MFLLAVGCCFCIIPMFNDILNSIHSTGDDLGSSHIVNVVLFEMSKCFLLFPFAGISHFKSGIASNEEKHWTEQLKEIPLSIVSLIKVLFGPKILDCFMEIYTFFFIPPPMRSDSSYLHLTSTFNNAATHDCLLWVKCSLFRECGHKILPKTDMFSKIDWQRFSFVWIRYSEMGKEIPETQFLTPKIDNNSKHNTNFLCIYGFWGDGCVEIWDVYCCGGGGCVKNRYVFHSTVLKVLTIEIAVRPHFYHTPRFKWSTNVQSIRVVFWFWQAMFLPITMHDCRRDGPARQYTLMWQKQPILCLPTNKHTIFGHYFHFYL